MEDIETSLQLIAEKKSIPFCYGCYQRAPNGRCANCGTDDLMRELPGCGVEYGLSWIIQELLQEHVSPADTLESFEQSVADCYSETVKIGWIEYDTASAIKELDPVSWNMAHSEYVDSEVESGILITLDNGSTHYWRHEVEQFINDNEPIE